MDGTEWAKVKKSQSQFRNKVYDVLVSEIVKIPFSGLPEPCASQPTLDNLANDQNTQPVGHAIETGAELEAGTEAGTEAGIEEGTEPSPLVSHAGDGNRSSRSE